MGLPSDRDIPSYLPFAIVSILLNPLFGMVATVFSVLSSRYFSSERIWHARLYSNLAFSTALVGIYATVLVIVMVYSYGKFPDDAYFDRQKIIDDNI